MAVNTAAGIFNLIRWGEIILFHKSEKGGMKKKWKKYIPNVIFPKDIAQCVILLLGRYLKR